VSESASHDPYAALRHTAYRRFLLGRAAFLVGGQMQMTAVGWQIYEQLGSKLALGLVGLVQIIPVVLLALPAGHAADHFDRRRIVAGGLGLYLLCSVGLAVLTWTRGAPWLTYALLFLVAVARSFTVPALGSLLPSVIPRGLWANAATWNSSLFELAGMLGPGFAGLLIALSGGATVVFLVAAGCALLAGVLFASIHVPPRVVKPRAPDLAGLLSGLRFMFKARLLLAAASLDLFAVLLGGATALLPVVAKDILQVGPAGFGWLRAAPSIGAVAMAFVTAHLPPWRRSGRVLLWSFVGFGVAVIVFGLSRNYWLSLAMLALTGVCDNLNVVIRQTLMQFITPDSMRGRVSAVNYIFIGCSNELGAFESGVAAQFLGTVPAIVAGGAGALLVVAVVARLSPALRRLGRLHDVTPVPE
jgi:MFS family permease